MVLHLLSEQKNWFVTKMMEPIVEPKKSQKWKTKVDIQAKVANFVAATNGSNKVEVIIVIGDDESRLKEKIK